VLNEQPRNPNLSAWENQRLSEIERRMRIEEPGLDQSLRSGRPILGSIDPVVAAMVAMIATPLIVATALLFGPAAGTGAVAVALVVLYLRARRSRRTSHTRPSAYR
jgi:hypothetical protein